jgi:7 transmembrane helices usually fused to an inactive transglutaminase
MTQAIHELPANQTTDEGPRKLLGGQLAMLALMFVLPLLLVAAKSPGLPSAAFLMEYMSFAHIPLIGHLLFVPLGAMLVVFFRLTLGVRVLGPFRPILIAFAFQLAGVLSGLIVLTLVVAIILTLRPVIHALRMPYFGRISVLLSVVAVLLSVGILSTRALHLDVGRGIAYFPVVVLCLVSEAFARTIKTEGVGRGLWRGSMTVLVAILISLLSGNSVLSHLLLNYPELLIMQIAAIIVISKYGAWHLLQRLDPPPAAHATTPAQAAHIDPPTPASHERKQALALAPAKY